MHKLGNAVLRRHIANAYIIDPASGFEGTQDLFIAEGRIVARGNAPVHFEADERIEAEGLYLCPGLVDLRTRLREPGNGIHGNMESELRAAAAGGVTSLACPPDTEPVADQASVIHDQLRQAERFGMAHVYPIGALTRNLAGQHLAEMATLRNAGAIGLGNGDRSIVETHILRNALNYAASLDALVFLHSEDPYLGRGHVHEGEVSTRLGLPSNPEAAETIGLARDLILAELSGARVHFQHLSSGAGLDLLNTVRPRLPLSADVSIHHLHLTHYDIGHFNANAKTTPPLRTHRDRDALRHGLAQNQIAAITSDHSPWHEDLNRDTFPNAPAGISSLETWLPLTLKLVDENVLSLMQAIEKITLGPAQVLGIPAGTLDIGAAADLCLFDPDARFIVQSELFHSKGKNTAYNGWDLRGQVRYTLVDGRLIYRSEKTHASS